MTRLLAIFHAGAALAIFCAGPAQAQGMYQWKDAQGRTHLSDKPPPGVDSPTRVTPRASNVVPADAAAKGRAAADLAASRMPAEAPAAPASAASATTAGTAPAARPGETDCQRRQREYQASMACFAPLRNAAGAIAPEAAKKCGPAMSEPPPC
jgi:hypothetical protein